MARTNPVRHATLAIALSMAWHAALAYTVVTREGRRLEAEGEPEYNQGKALLVLPGGMRIIIDESDIDKPATVRANGVDLAPATFRNEHLAMAKGLSVVEGDVAAEGKGQDMPPRLAEEPGVRNVATIEFDHGPVNATRRVAVEYPRDAFEAGEKGTVVVGATIDVDGMVTDVEVVQSASPSLDRAVMEAIRQWRFEPPVVYGEPTPLRFRYTVQFELPPGARRRPPSGEE